MKIKLKGINKENYIPTIKNLSRDVLNYNEQIKEHETRKDEIMKMPMAREVTVDELNIIQDRIDGHDEAIVERQAKRDILNYMSCSLLVDFHEDLDVNDREYLKNQMKRLKHEIHVCFDVEVAEIVIEDKNAA